MPSAEARYVRRIGDYILEIMPESQRRKEMVLAYITEKILGGRRPMRQLALAAVIALASSAVTVGAGHLVQSAMSNPGSLAARIIEMPDGSLALAIVRHRQGRPTRLIHREAITADYAAALLADPLWQEKAISKHARGA